jgi:hypothetical protein
MSNIFYIPYLSSKKYACTIEPASASVQEANVSLVSCEMAGLKNQEFANVDIPELIADLPNIIDAVQNHRKKSKIGLLQIRISEQDRRKIEKQARDVGQTVSTYLRSRVLDTKIT